MDTQAESTTSINHHGGGTPPAGWPLGLETMHLSMDVMRGTQLDPLGLYTPSFSSISPSSSDFDTESSVSFFHDKSVTLGTLIGLRPDRSTRYARNIVHPEEHMGAIARRPRNYRRLRLWKSLTGCMHFTSRLQSSALYLAQLLKTEKRGGVEKVYMNAIYEESEEVLTDATNPPLLDHNRDQSIRAISERFPSHDLEIIEQTPSTEDGKNWSAPETSQIECSHSREDSQGLCMPFVSNILLKIISSRE
ncbi:hypothetical protein SUGI_0068060 [Cryptomeria japonica]|uniref:uncharacterized protein LOC131060176 n=1 Tax=Cryptomeria japonica TaxID=3369 RepID=UPI002408C04E|nr:uncharacterized protein LOC131060176 [Cryptomeria japonica]GLJ07485.1 hypothetical protein SUGI_0068060 [Cryptomeria japonica]